MSAPTSTLGPRRQRLPQVLIVLGVLIASGVATFTIVSAARHRAGESSDPAFGVVRDAGAPESGR